MSQRPGSPTPCSRASPDAQGVPLTPPDRQRPVAARSLCAGYAPGAPDHRSPPLPHHRSPPLPHHRQIRGLTHLLSYAFPTCLPLFYTARTPNRERDYHRIATRVEKRWRPLLAVTGQVVVPGEFVRSDGPFFVAPEGIAASPRCTGGTANELVRSQQSPRQVTGETSPEQRVASAAREATASAPAFAFPRREHQ